MTRKIISLLLALVLTLSSTALAQDAVAVLLIGKADTDAQTGASTRSAMEDKVSIIK